MSKYCMSCGAANAENAGVCTRCGKRLPGGGIVPPPPVQTDQNGVWEKIQKLLSEKKTRYGIGIAVLCVVVLVVVISMGNKGIVGTWEAKTGDNWILTFNFNKDNTGYLTWDVPDSQMKPREFLIEWRKMDGNRYMLSCQKLNEETFIDLGSNEFVINSGFCVEQNNVVYHRK